MICGVIRGALEDINIKVECKYNKIICLSKSKIINKKY